MHIKKLGDSLTRSWCLLAYVFIAAMVFGIIYSSQFQLSRISVGNLAVLFFFHGLFIETCLLLCVSLILLHLHTLFRYCAYLIIAGYITVNVLQLLSLSMSGEFVSRLAVENVNHISLLLNTKNIIITLAAISFVVMPILFIEKCIVENGPWRTTVILCFALVLASAGFYQVRSDPENTLRHQADFLLEQLQLERNYPIVMLISVLRTSNDEMELVGEIDHQLLSQLKFSYKKSTFLPLYKERVTDLPPPFRLLKEYEKVQPNIIVFFTEGFSARTSNVYTDVFENLTPSLLEFSKEAMVIDNYFNHTAATYRGLQGQLCSIYPYYGGAGGWYTKSFKFPDTNFYCLNDIFAEKGYETIFIDTHKKHKAFVDELMAQIGFQTILTSENLTNDYLNKEKPTRRDSLSDQQLYRALIGLLKSKEGTRSKKPFFIGMYNLETHAFQDTNKGGIKYKDGDNNALNTIHNLDNAFGKFWQYFKNSSLVDNTIIIFTADHTHYKEKSFVKAMEQSGQTDYKKAFTGRIPLIIFDRSRELPPRFDAKSSSSIDFAPSLLHYLGLQNTPTSFVGTSIFEPDKLNSSIGSNGATFFWIENNIIYHKREVKKLSSDTQKLFNNARLFLREGHQLELQNRLWGE